MSVILGSVRRTKLVLCSKVKGRFLGICVPYDTFVIVLFCPTLKVFLAKLVFSRCFRKFSVTTPHAEMTEIYTYKLLIFQIFLISRNKLSCFVIFSASVMGRVWVKVAPLSVTSAVLLSLQRLLLLLLSSSSNFSLLSFGWEIFTYPGM